MRSHFDFVGRTRTWVMVSGSLMIISILALGLLRLNLSIDFVGGSSYLLENIGDGVTSQQLNQAATGAGGEDVSAQVRESADGVFGALVKTAALEPGSPEATAVEEALVAVSGADDIQSTFVGPTWGQRISAKALQALVVFMVVVILYISIRLEFKMAVAAVVALGHDLLLTAGVYALVGFTVSPSTVIAVLTIMGYSLYDTVVVFDRVQETGANLGQPGRRTYSEAMNTSLNEVLWRSLNTTITSLLPVGALLVIGSRVLGAATLRDLSLALFVGMATGAYSSLFVAGPFLAWLKEREPEMQKLRVRAAAREVREAELASAVASGDAAAAAKAKATTGVPTTDYVRGKGRTKRSKR